MANKNSSKLGLYLVVSLVNFYIFYFSIRHYFKKKKYSHIPGPESKGILGFYLGNLRELKEKTENGKKYQTYILQCFEKYGPVFKIEIFDRIIINIVEPEAAKEVLINKNYPKVPYFCKAIAYPHNQRFLGRGLLTETNNEVWKMRRALFQRGFSKQSLMDSIIEYDAKADLLVERLRKLADGTTMFSFKKEISHIMLDVIAKVAFGMELNSLNDSENDFNKSIKIVISGLLESYADPFMIFKPTKWSHLLNFKKALNYLRETCRGQVIKRIKSIQNQDYVPEDLLSLMIADQKGRNDFDMEQLVDDFLTFFIAGQETSSISISFCLMELGRNREAFERVRNEIDEIIGVKQKISYEDVQKLVYLGCAYNEALRLWPPVISLNRMISEDLKINDLQIPKNTEVAVCVGFIITTHSNESKNIFLLKFSIYSSGRSQRFFTKPLEFKPERFLIDSSTNQNSIHSYTYFPFSMGPRSCIAQNIAQVEAKIFLAKIIQNFDYKLDPSQSFDGLFLGNLNPKDGVRCTIKLRNN